MPSGTRGHAYSVSAILERRISVSVPECSEMIFEICVESAKRNPRSKSLPKHCETHAPTIRATGTISRRERSKNSPGSRIHQLKREASDSGSISAHDVSWLLMSSGGSGALESFIAAAADVLRQSGIRLLMIPLEDDDCFRLPLDFHFRVLLFPCSPACH